jgi:hypothetical protein
MVEHLVGEVVPAYLDPGSGSIIFQAVVAGAMAVSLTVKIYWRRLRGLFRRQER